MCIATGKNFKTAHGAPHCLGRLTVHHNILGASADGEMEAMTAVGSGEVIVCAELAAFINNHVCPERITNSIPNSLDGTDWLSRSHSLLHIKIGTYATPILQSATARQHPKQ
jgi:hypothetical protein